MAQLPKSIQNLINEFAKLPGIGPKTAQRLSFYLLKQPQIDVQALGSAVSQLQKNIIYCSICHNMAEKNPCSICSDSKRDKNLICVVEDSLDVQAMDQIADFRGVYHVLGGAISPLDGIGPENLKIKELFDRLTMSKGIFDIEVILATNPSLEGEATAMYIAKQIKNHPPAGEAGNSKFKNVKVTRIGRGLPMGADLEYADEFTLSKALEGRREY
ncbi:MAG: recombination protein RecR [Candidatus Doudnabacteria bacterium RIFCSPLOWO2_02_FULL_48_8]|uniref:Recombination protein RecR n=1 Tax=Candidatus Doudnabacteria bacterium RIFCSPHIGHO2_01_FULL_46_24 TaxID=1817825 RepID=A0A1F5NUP4_9BACT|nr:MAG: recombination protein RecR [Candidatus Doudnabacteria bacterium RIFCSPHIGHO2_01_FULL_46_24]OGE94213.1 MAG: recombination protein RecR [Candidatus Doudnabacteria bacterium RIFCSPHIGHO2_12_FULL_48_11]OGE95431.1 MAG: recombination protein RecR [Candidatus Doudnabacteria bacterium RIFCSPLOWO2_02_FULL_48_8]